MKITDYEKVQTLDSSNMVLIDGNNGTKTILVADFIKSLIGLISSQDFISGVNLSELTQINALTADDKLLIGTAEGNKAIVHQPHNRPPRSDHRKLTLRSRNLHNQFQIQYHK